MHGGISGKIRRDLVALPSQPPATLSLAAQIIDKYSGLGRICEAAKQAMGAYHIFGGTLADKVELLDQTPENGTHPTGHHDRTFIDLFKNASRRLFMETVTTLIVTALVNGIVDQAAKDTYLLLKGMILRKYAKVSIAQLEEAPTSKARQAVVEEDLQRAGADQDEEVVALAKVLLDTIQNTPRSSKTPVSTASFRPEDLVERAERKAGTRAIGQVMERHVQGIMDARSRYPLNDFDLLSLRLVNNHSVPQSIRTEVGRLHSKIRIIIEEVASRIEERKYRSSEKEIENMPLAFADRQKECVRWQRKQVALTFQSSRGNNSKII